MHFTAAPAEHEDVSDTGDGLQLFLDFVLDDARDVDGLPLGADGIQDHRRGIGIELLNDRWIDGRRKIAEDEIDLVADFLCRDVHVFLQHERDEDLRQPFDRRGAELVDSRNRADRAFDDVGDFGFDLLRRRAGIGR